MVLIYRRQYAWRNVRSLLQAISKKKRGKGSRDNLIEEMADVMICMEILKQVYGISDNEIQNYVCQKQNRCIERMKSDES